MPATVKHVYQFGAFRLDATDRLLYRSGELVPLAPKAIDTLVLLVTHRGQVLTKDEMMKRLWPDTFVEEGTLAQYISLLRKALGDSAAWIENYPRRGYRFTADVEEVEAGPDKLPETAPSREQAAQPSRIIWVGLAVLGVVALAAAGWVNRREGPSRSLQSIAVLPFRTVSDSGEDYLADGITEALITRLAGLEGLSVVSYSRVRQFKGSQDDAAAIGRQLGVEALIEGTVRVAAGRLRVSVHAVDSTTGYTIWALDRFEAEPERVFDIEGQVAEATARRVRGQLTATERELVTKARSTNPEAYDLVLRARGADPPTAVEMLHRAVQLDPEFADAYGWLAHAQIRTYSLRLAGQDTVRKAISNANQALSKDPNSAVATRALVLIHHASGRHVEGLLISRRDLESSPDDLDAAAAAAEAYFWTGLYDRAIPLYEKAFLGDRTNIRFRRQMARLYLYLGQHEKALEVISSLPLSQAGLYGMMVYAETGPVAHVVQIARGPADKEFGGPNQPPYGFDAYMRGYALSAAGDAAGATEIWNEGLRYGESLLAKNENTYARSHDAMIYAKLGRREQALGNIKKSLAADPQHPMCLFFAAQTYSLLGLRRETLETLKEAVENGFLNLPMIEYHSRPGLSFNLVRDDPEFHAIRADLTRRIEDLRARN